MKKMSLSFFAMLIAFVCKADQYTDYNGVTWTYSVTAASEWESWCDGYATITGVSGASGDVTIPGSFSVTTGSYDEYWNWVEVSKTYYVNSIQSGAFSGCSQIISLYIPDSLLMSLGTSMFEGCTGLKAFKTSESSYSSYKAKNGLLLYGWSDDSMSLYMVPAGATDVVIPNCVYSISYGAFNGCKSLQSISVPTSVSAIDSYAFEGGKIPAKIYFKPGDGARVKGLFADAGISIADSAFSKESTAYKSLYQIVGDGSYEWQIDGSVSRNGCGSYRSAQIGSSQTTYITFSADLSKGVSWWWKTSSENYFDKLICYINGSEYASISGESDWEKISLPTYYGISTIKIAYSKDGGGDNGDDCGWVDGLFEKDNSAWVCDKLSDSSLEIIGTTYSTGDVVIPCEKDSSPITSLGAWLFECCSGLNSVIISNGITTIGQGTFADCVALNSISIPDTVTAIGANAFRNTGILNSASGGMVVVSNAVIGVKEPCPDLVVIPANINVVADGAFDNSTTLKKICTDVGDSVRVSNLLENAGVSYKIVSIVEKAVVLFAANGGVCDINSITHVPGEAYGDLPYPERSGFIFAGWYTEVDGGTLVKADTISSGDGQTQTLYAHWVSANWLYSVNDDNTARITGCACEVKGRISLPSEVDGHIVTGVGASAFYGNTELVGVSMPDSIAYVGARAFEGTAYWDNCDNGFIICGKILLGYKRASSEYPTSLTIPEGVEIIADSAFNDYNLDSLTTVTFPSTLKRIGKSAFYGRAKIGGLTFQSGLIEIDDRAFCGCAGISTLNIPDTIKRIGCQAFKLTDNYNKSVLSHISIHANGLVICEDAFRYEGNASSSSSASISLTGSEIEVGDRAFYGYKHGNGVVLDLTGVSKIGNYAFGYAGYNSAYRYSDDGLYDIGSVELRITDHLQYASTNAFNWAAVGRVKVPDWNAVYGRAGWLNFLSERTSASSAYEGFYCCLIVNDEYIDTIEIPDGTVSVPVKAFKGLRINHFEIPASVETIGDQAFAYTRATIQFNGTPPTCDGDPFARCYSGGYSAHADEWIPLIENGLWNGLLMNAGDVLDYASALDAPGLTFTTTGYANWFVQSVDKYDGDNAMRSNSDIRNGAGLSCEITGPAELSYWWKLNRQTSGYNRNFLSLYIDGKFITNVTSNATWEHYQVQIEAGKHNVQWSYSGVKHYRNYSDEAGYIDSVSVSYNVHFDLGAGTVVSGDLDQKVQHGTAAKAPVVSAPSGYIFDGWDKGLEPISGPVTYVAMYRKPTIAEALNNAGNSKLQLSNDPISPWGVSDVAHDGAMALRSGEIDDGNVCEFTATFKGAGTLSFFWKASTEAYKSTPIDYGVVLLDGVEKSKIGGDKDWCQVVIEIAETNTHTVIWRYVKDEADAMGEDCIWVDELAWIQIDPIPELGVDATSAEVEDALNGSADTKLTENIKDGTTYGQYREWANNVKAKGGSSPAGAEAVKNAPNAWLSFALGSETLIEAVPTDGDLKVDNFEPATESGKFDFTVSVKDIEVGSDATADNLKKVFGLEGGTSLEPGGLSSANVNITFGTPENGKVKFTAGPKNANEGSFFMRVKMTP